MHHLLSVVSGELQLNLLEGVLGIIFTYRYSTGTQVVVRTCMYVHVVRVHEVQIKNNNTGTCM